MALSERTFSFVSVDQACFARVWGLKKQFPGKYSWIIPVPGEWHWDMAHSARNLQGMGY